MTALKTYYQRKADKQQCEWEATALRADSAALEIVLKTVQASSRAGSIAGPMLLAGSAATAVLAALNKEICLTSRH